MFFTIATQFGDKEQLKYLTHMFYVWVPYYKLYKKRHVLLLSHIKIRVPFWDEFKKV